MKIPKFKKDYIIKDFYPRKSNSNALYILEKDYRKSRIKNGEALNAHIKAAHSGLYNLECNACIELFLKMQ